MLNFENISCLNGLQSRILNPLNFHQTKISNSEFLCNRSSLRYGQTPILYSHLFLFLLTKILTKVYKGAIFVQIS